MSVQLEDARLQLPDGKMHYQSLGAGPAVVLLHSLPGSARSWARVMEPLARKHSVYALDTMGQGDSDKPSRDYAIEDYASSVVHFMRAKGIGKATLIGNSVGAVIAVQIAAATPSVVDKLVLVGTSWRETESARKEALAASRAQHDAAGNRLPRSLEDLKQHFVHVSPELQAEVNSDAAKAGVWAWQCLVANFIYDIVPALKKVEAKTLIVYGEMDRQRSRAGALMGYIRGARQLIVPDAGHLPQVDNPRGFVEAVLSFLG